MGALGPWPHPRNYNPFRGDLLDSALLVALGGRSYNVYIRATTFRIVHPHILGTYMAREGCP